MREARDLFDYVIIDAPPLGIFTDATVLINQADGALLVVRANRTRYSHVDRVLESLPRERMMGVILNQSEDVLDETHYNYGYYKKNWIRSFSFAFCSISEKKTRAANLRLLTNECK